MAPPEATKQPALILLVDDEPEIREVYAQLLTQNGYRTDSASNGEEAIQKLGLKPYDLVISDIKMPKVDGIQLLTWVKKNQPHVKAILSTGLNTLEMTKAALDVGCEAFLAKPVKSNELIATVKFALTDASDPGQNVENYGKVAVEDFVSGKNLPYSIFVQISSKRFVKIAHSGEDLDLDRIYNLKYKGVSYLWLEKEAFNQYQAMSQKLAAATSTKSQIPADKRAKMITSACELAAQKLKLNGFGMEAMISASSVVDSALTLATDSVAATALLEILYTRENNRFAHLSTTALLAALVTQVMGWTNRKNIYALTVGCFFHDIGLLGMPGGLEFLPLNSMSLTQRELYMSHPERGIKILETFKGFPSEAMTIVAQHHETGKEKGFPRKLAINEVFPMAKIARVLDEFAYKLLSTDPAKRIPGKKVLEDMVADTNNGNFDFTTLCALESLLITKGLNEAKRQFTISLTEKKTLKA